MTSNTRLNETFARHLKYLKQKLNESVRDERGKFSKNISDQQFQKLPDNLKLQYVENKYIKAMSGDVVPFDSKFVDYQRDIIFTDQEAKYLIDHSAKFKEMVKTEHYISNVFALLGHDYQNAESIKQIIGNDKVIQYAVSLYRPEDNIDFPFDDSDHRRRHDDSEFIKFLRYANIDRQEIEDELEKKYPSVQKANSYKDTEDYKRYLRGDDYSGPID